MVSTARLALAAAVAAYASAAVLGSGTAWACSCIGDLTAAQHFESATYVFSGTPVSAEKNEDGGLDWVIRVDAEQKGDVDLLQHLNVNLGPAACGIDLEARTRYQFYAHDAEDGELIAYSCNGTHELTGAAASPFTVAPPPDGPSPAAMAGIAAAAAALGTAAVVRRRRAAR